MISKRLAGLIIAGLVLGGAQALAATEGGEGASYSDVYDRPFHSGRPWKMKLGLGGGVSQLVSEDRPGHVSRAEDSAFQLAFSGGVERELVGPLSLEGAVALDMQFRSPGGAASSSDTQFIARYVEVPVGARLEFNRSLSVGLGGFAAVPIDPMDALPASKRLLTTDVGALATVRWLQPMNRLMDWTVELTAQRGLWHLGDAGTEPNHLRALGATVGLRAVF